MRWLIGVIVVLVLVAGLWWLEQQRQAELRPDTGVSVPTESEQPEPRYPLPKPEIHPAPSMQEPAQADAQSDAEQQAEAEPESQPPLPELSDSDDVALEALSALLGEEFTQRWIKPEFVIARTVAIINSLEGDAPALKTRMLRPLDTEPRTREIEGEEALLWTAANAERYDSLIDTLESVPPQRAAALYGRYYSLFQHAWDELGETEPYFNDRLIDIIDHLLNTPEVDLPFKVVPQEGRLYFADESLQEESWGRKLLLRMGPERAERIKDWLATFRNAATGQQERSVDG